MLDCCPGGIVSCHIVTSILDGDRLDTVSWLDLKKHKKHTRVGGYLLEYRSKVYSHIASICL